MSPVGAPQRRRSVNSSLAGQEGAGSGRTRGWFVAEQPSFRSRSIWMLLALVAVGVMLCGKLIDVQVRQGAQLRAAAASQHQMSLNLPGHRGQIVDSSGNILASNVAVYDIWADPAQIPADQRIAVAKNLAAIVNQSPDTIAGLLAKPLQFVYLAKGQSQDAMDRIAALNIAGIGAEPRDKRIYNASPLSGASFAEPLLGYVDTAGTGRYGVEQYYNGILSGKNGSESTLRDLRGNAIVLSHEQRQDAHNGANLKLGLDSRVQYWAEQAIAKGVSDAQASSGEVAVMDTKTGVIRAWAQYPSYSANDYGSGDVSSFRDQSIADLYEPGSTMKVVTFAGGLDNGAITPATQLNEGPVSVGGYTIRDWDKKAHGLITMQEVLDQSLNDGAIKVMELMGHDAFYKNLLRFGIGMSTGVDLAGEQESALPPESQWSDVNYATAAFGQGVQVTPIEMLAAINAVGNGGVWVQPHAVQATIDPATGASTPFVPRTRQVMSASAAATLGTMMTGVVDHKDGEGFMARIQGFQGQVAGKTGTADEPTNGQYSGSLIVSFGGFLPASNPQFTMLVVLRYPTETKTQRFGAFLAAPVWKDIAQVMIDQWRIQP